MFKRDDTWLKAMVDKLKLSHVTAHLTEMQHIKILPILYIMKFGGKYIYSIC